jgi:hypothetical protein
VSAEQTKPEGKRRGLVKRSIIGEEEDEEEEDEAVVVVVELLLLLLFVVFVSCLLSFLAEEEVADRFLPEIGGNGNVSCLIFERCAHQ